MEAPPMYPVYPDVPMVSGSPIYVDNSIFTSCMT